MTRPERDLPLSVEAEMALLGAILLNNAVFERVGILSPDHFSLRLHATIFGLMQQLIGAGRAADPITLAARLAGNPDLGETRPAAYMMQLAASVSSAANAVDYACTIVELWQRRQVILGADDVAAAARLDDGEPVESVIRRHADHLDALLIHSGHGRPMRSLAEAAQEWQAEVQAAQRGIGGLRHGIEPLETLIPSLRGGKLIVLGARPGVGKTMVAWQMASLVSTGAPVLFMSLEMPAAELVGRMAASDLGIDQHDQQRVGGLHQLHWDRIVEYSARLTAKRLMIDDRPSLTMAQISVAARRHARTHGLALLVVDYLGRIASSDRGARRHEELGRNVQALKTLARELNCCVLVLAQLNRDIDRREAGCPTLSDLAGSSEIEAEADAVIILDRPEMRMSGTEPERKAHEPESAYADRLARWAQQRKDAEGRLDMHLVKHRGGRIGMVSAQVDLAAQRIEARQSEMVF